MANSERHGGEFFGSDDSPKSMKGSRSASPTQRKSKGGFIFLDKCSTEPTFEGPNYAAPIQRHFKDTTDVGPLYITPATGNRASVPEKDLFRPKSRGPGQMAARPHTAQQTTVPDRPLVGSAQAAAGPIASRPPGAVRPSTGSSSRNNARKIVVPSSVNVV